MNGNDYQDEILALYKEGFKPTEIAKKLGFKYHQPVYRVLVKTDFYKPYRKCNYKRKYQIDEFFFESIDNEYKAYILGFIAADGHVDIKHKRIQIRLAEQDLDILIKIRNAFLSTHPIKLVERKNSFPYGRRKVKEVILDLNSSKLVKQLVGIGFTSNKTYTLNVEIFNCIPNNLKHHFLRGYFDGDGSLVYGIRYSSGTKYLVQICGIEDFLLNSFGKKCTTNCKIYKPKTTKNMVVWKISKKSQVDDFIRYIYKNATIYLNRKYDIAKRVLI